jgi:ketosteroid isomerase-like protein
MTLTSATTTQAVLDHHLQCFGAGDLPGVLADYAPDAVICTPTGVLRGPDSMASLFQGFFAEFAKPGARFDLQLQTVEGDIGYLLWAAETADNTYESGTDTFVVRDGKILVHTFAAKATPKA